MNPQPLKRTPFHDFHLSAGGRMVDFAGWEMPLVYRSIVEEHEHTRKSGSVFDVSHMGRLHFSGSDAQAFLSRVATRRLDDMVVGQSRYSLICGQTGGVLDDVIISRDARHWLMVCNASNRLKLIQHFTDLRRQLSMDFDLADQTEATAMLAIQGPKVIDKLSEVLPVDLKGLKRYRFLSGSYMMLVKFTVFRSGYTGEDGVELILPASTASMAIKALAGRFDRPEATLKPAGLGARDTLRLEAGMPLYGHELTEQIDPISAGLGWAVDLSKDFIGVEPLRRINEQGPARKLVGLELQGRRIARQGAPVVRGGAVVGVVTSGTLGPTVQKSIAMAYVNAECSTEGCEVEVDLKGQTAAARVVRLPFYVRASK
jgi:aminomethyltransferase